MMLDTLNESQRLPRGSGSRGQDGKAGCILIYYHG